ncbi:PIN domain-containing protein [Methanotorris igneus]|uniref:PilT protein domain protein n=1 Tax=Methanotorris igneus (strain DSM 5666 / JCM 11834 / Kol 5) TaxID=880724 RepID=F6BEF8_METIK|nr:PIN domain-containing protein [Methanotorris igneus]AEF95619.1 PilT protein domain protein [Methanotorris igneus Kol 5]
MYLVVPDTNFLIYAFKHKINFDYELERALNAKYRVVILKCIYDELQKLQRELKGKEKLSVSLALKMIEKYGIIDYNKGTYTDEIIINFAKENKNVIVCTNDKELKNKLIDLNIPIIFVRQKNYFDVIGLI